MTRTERVRFESEGRTLVGMLHLPDATAPAPAVIVTGSWTTVKEQMPANYAPRLAQRGFAAFTFDFSGFGESEGEPREVESARAKAADFSAAVRFLSAWPHVDGTRVGVLPICASAGYLALAAGAGLPIRSVAMVAPWLHDRAIVEAMYGGAAAVEERLELARRAQDAFDRTGVVEYVKAASNTDATAAMYWEGDALDYYLNPARGAVPEWGGRFALMAWKEWLEFDALTLASSLDVPTRIVTGEGTATPGGAKAFGARMRAPHDFIWLDGNQFDFYDDARTVSAATQAAVEHFRSTLC